MFPSFDFKKMTFQAVLFPFSGKEACQEDPLDKTILSHWAKWEK
jgi:hypothetical protein